MKMKRNKYFVPIFALTASIVAVGTLAVALITHSNVKPVNKPAVGVVTADIKSKKLNDGVNIEETKPAYTKSTDEWFPVKIEKTKTEENKPNKNEEKKEKTEQQKPESKQSESQSESTDSRSAKMLELARKAVEKCTDSSMTKEEKLKAAFDYIKKNYLEGSRRGDYRELDWPVVYASDLLEGGKGDCFSYGAAFAYMAKAIGYEESYACNSGGHGWAEIDGKIYDPEWSMHSSNYSYFGMSYDDPCDVAYKGSIGFAEWTHVKV